VTWMATPPEVAGGVPGSAEEKRLLAALATLLDRLLADFGGTPLSDLRVHEELVAVCITFDGARIRHFLPILIERDVRCRLREA
jgi:hypothetical protein